MGCGPERRAAAWKAWTTRADTFGVWFSLVARLSALGRRDDGRLVLRYSGTVCYGGSN